MRKNPCHIKTIRNYLNEENEIVSFRRFKKVLNYLIKNNNPEALVIASTQQYKNMSDDEFEFSRKKYLTKAINLNFSPAMVELAEDYYQKGHYQKSFELYDRAAELNHSYALKQMALVYELGLHGYEKNLEKANFLKNKATNGISWSIERGFNAYCSDYDYIE